MRKIMVGMLCMLSVTVGRAEGQWFVEGGVMYRGGMKLEITGRSADVAYSFDTASGERITVPTGSLLKDDGSAQIFRSFDDGYVGPSGSATWRNDGRTQYWGYERADQFDGDSNLRFHKTLTDAGSRDRQSSTVIGENAAWAGSDSDGTGQGGVVTIGRVMVEHPRYTWSLFFQGGWLDGISWTTRNRSDDRIVLQTTDERSSYEIRETYRFTYDTFGSTALPPAPYSQTDPNAPARPIADRPHDVQRVGDRVVGESDEVIGTRVLNVSSDVSVQTDARSLILGVGPRLEFRPRKTVSLYAQAAVTFNMIDVEMDRYEVFRDASGGQVLSDALQESQTTWRPGGSVAAGVALALPKATFMRLGGGYDYVDAYDLVFGPDRLSVDLSGYRVDAVFGWRFGGAAD